MQKALAGVSAFYDDEKENTQLTKLQILKTATAVTRSYQYAHSFTQDYAPSVPEKTMKNVLKR
jgi:hypothetical protein